MNKTDFVLTGIIPVAIALCGGMPHTLDAQIVVPAKPDNAKKCVPRSPNRLGPLPRIHSPRRISVDSQTTRERVPAGVLPILPVPGAVPFPDQSRSPASIPVGSASRKSEAIREKVEQLRRLLEAKAAARKSLPVAEPKPSGRANEVTENPAETKPSAAVITVTIPEQPHAARPDTVAEELSGPNIVMTAPVNRLKLADNLFGAGKNTLALQAYTSINIQPLPETDQAWVQFQIGSCHRRLGETSKAEKLYRIVASYKHGGAIVDASRWWLDRLQSKKELNGALAKLTQIVDSLEESPANAN